MLETGDPRYDQNIWGPGGSVQGKRTYSRTKVDQGALTAALAAAAGGAAEVLGVEFGDFEAESRAWLEGMVEREWGSGRDQFTVMKGMWFGIWRVHEMFRESGVAADIVVRTRWDAVFVKPLGIRAQNIYVHGAECVRVTVEVPGYPPSAVTCQDGGPYGEQMRNLDRCEAGDRRCRGVVAVPVRPTTVDDFLSVGPPGPTAEYCGTFERLDPYLDMTWPQKVTIESESIVQINAGARHVALQPIALFYHSPRVQGGRRRHVRLATAPGRAVTIGHLEMLQWLVASGYPFDPHNCLDIAHGLPPPACPGGRPTCTVSLPLSDRPLSDHTLK